MSQDNFEKFRQLVLHDSLLQTELQKFTDRDSFIRRVVEIGAERGFSFTAENVSEAINENRRAWIQKWI